MELESQLSVFLPLAAVERVAGFMRQYKVRLRFVNARKTKLGDYRRPVVGSMYHSISVDGTLSPYFCLLVLLHEMAHLSAFVKYDRLSRPHGYEWQQEYASLLSEYVQAGAFPDEVSQLITKYVSHIPLNRTLSMELERRLRYYGKQSDRGEKCLNDLNEGDRFVLVDYPDKVFRALAKRRTRWLCRDLNRNVDCLVLGYASVRSLDDA